MRFRKESQFRNESESFQGARHAQKLGDWHSHGIGIMDTLSPELALNIAKVTVFHSREIKLSRSIVALHR